MFLHVQGKVLQHWVFDLSIWWNLIKDNQTLTPILSREQVPTDDAGFWEWCRTHWSSHEEVVSAIRCIATVKLCGVYDVSLHVLREGSNVIDVIGSGKNKLHIIQNRQESHFDALVRRPEDTSGDEEFARELVNKEKQRLAQVLADRKLARVLAQDYQVPTPPPRDTKQHRDSARRFALLRNALLQTTGIRLRMPPPNGL